jgi:hypothetical protein
MDHRRPNTADTLLSGILNLAAPETDVSTDRFAVHPLAWRRGHPHVSHGSRHIHESRPIERADRLRARYGPRSKGRGSHGRRLHAQGISGTAALTC